MRHSTPVPDVTSSDSTPAAPSALGRLHDLAVFVGAEEDLRAHLQEMVRLAASVTDAAACSIMLLSEGDEAQPRLKLWCTTEQSLPPNAWRETPGRGESIAGRVLEQGASLRIADLGASEFAPLARHRDSLGASCLCVPVHVGSAVIGVMNLSGRPGAEPFDASDQRLAEIVATLIGKSVQVDRLQTLLRSRVVQASLAREERAAVTRLTDGSVPPARLAKLLARTFFKDLASAGFEPGQIIEAASEIVTMVSEDIKRFKRRTGREREG